MSFFDYLINEHGTLTIYNQCTSSCHNVLGKLGIKFSEVLLFPPPFALNVCEQVQ